MKKKKEAPEELPSRPPNAYKLIGDKCRLSERTVRNAFSGIPVTWQTAQTLAHAAGIPVCGFRIKDDMRGRNKKNAARH